MSERSEYENLSPDEQEIWDEQEAEESKQG